MVINYQVLGGILYTIGLILFFIAFYNIIKLRNKNNSFGKESKKKSHSNKFVMFGRK
jgi:hypothetical protein